MDAPQKISLSVIVPVYNTQEYLPRCLESVLENSPAMCEIILVENGSNASTVAFCNEFARTRLRSVPHTVLHLPIADLSTARNAGLKIARGEYVAFLDSDDFWLRNINLAQIAASSSADAIILNTIHFFPEKKMREDGLEDVAFINAHTPLETFSYLVKHDRFRISACAAIVKRTLIEENYLTFVEHLHSEDVDWTLKIWQNINSVTALNGYSYAYCHRKNSLSTRFSFEVLCSYDRIFEMWQERSMEPRWKKTTMAFLAQLYVSCLYRQSEIEKKYRTQAKKILTKHVHLLRYSLSRKAYRAEIVHFFFGKKILFFVFGIYGKLKMR